MTDDHRPRSMADGNMRGNTLTSVPKVSWRRKRYFAANSMLVRPNDVLPLIAL